MNMFDTTKSHLFWIPPGQTKPTHIWKPGTGLNPWAVLFKEEEEQFEALPPQLVTCNNEERTIWIYTPNPNKTISIDELRQPR